MEKGDLEALITALGEALFDTTMPPYEHRIGIDLSSIYDTLKCADITEYKEIIHAHINHVYSLA